MVCGRCGVSVGRWPLVAFLRIRRPALTEGRAPGGVYAGSDPAVAAARAGRAGQFLKKVNWNGSPMKISRPPGIVAANAYRTCSAPPDGSAPLRHLYICL